MLVAGLCGPYDDVAGAGDPRHGLRAHLGALSHGEVTSGAVELPGIPAAGLAAGAVLKERPFDTVLALGAPGLPRRAPGAGRTAAAAPGPAAAVLPGGLGRRTMPGGTGALARGAAVGPRSWRAPDGPVSSPDTGQEAESDTPSLVRVI